MGERIQENTIEESQRGSRIERFQDDKSDECIIDLRTIDDNNDQFKSNSGSRARILSYKDKSKKFVPLTM